MCYNIKLDCRRTFVGRCGKEGAYCGDGSSKAKSGGSLLPAAASILIFGGTLTHVATLFSVLHPGLERLGSLF